MSALAIVEGPSPLTYYETARRALVDAKAVDDAKHIRDAADLMLVLAKKANDTELLGYAVEIKADAERRLGGMIFAQSEAGLTNKGGGTGANQYRAAGSPTDPAALPTLAEAGINKRLADQARKVAALAQEDFDARKESQREQIASGMGKITVNILKVDQHVRGAFGTGENEWYTPDEYIELARKVLGEIDLDPASSEFAQRTVKAATFYNEEANGLDKTWVGRVWLNPPYAQPAISHFADKMVEEWDGGHVSDAIMLTHNYTDTGWFQKLAHAATAICFTRGRIRFVSPAGEQAAPTQGQAFFYFGKKVAKFAKAFADVGFIVEVRR